MDSRQQFLNELLVFLLLTTKDFRLNIYLVNLTNFNLCALTDEF